MLTPSQVYRRYVVLHIGSRGAFMPPVKFAEVYNRVRRNWLKDKAAESETEYIRRVLGAFRRQKTLINPGRTIDLTELAEGVSGIRSIQADFQTPYGVLRGKTCEALTDDRLNSESDPNARGDDWFPRYLEEDLVTLTIYSETVPLSVTIRYLLMPPPIPVPGPESTKEEPLLESAYETVIDELLQRVMADDALPTQQPTYSALTRQDIPAREQNP